LALFYIYAPGDGCRRQARLPPRRSPPLAVPAERACRVESFLFLPRNVEALYLTVDDPRGFAAALNRAIVRAS